MPLKEDGRRQQTFNSICGSNSLVETHYKKKRRQMEHELACMEKRRWQTQEKSLGIMDRWDTAMCWQENSSNVVVIIGYHKGFWLTVDPVPKIWHDMRFSVGPKNF